MEDASRQDRATLWELTELLEEKSYGLIPGMVRTADDKLVLNGEELSLAETASVARSFPRVWTLLWESYERLRNNRDSPEESELYSRRKLVTFRCYMEEFMTPEGWASNRFRTMGTHKYVIVSLFDDPEAYLGDGLGEFITTAAFVPELFDAADESCWIELSGETDEASSGTPRLFFNEMFSQRVVWASDEDQTTAPGDSVSLGAGQVWDMVIMGELLNYVDGLPEGMARSDAVSVLRGVRNRMSAGTLAPEAIVDLERVRAARTGSPVREPKVFATVKFYLEAYPHEDAPEGTAYRLRQKGSQRIMRFAETEDDVDEAAAMAFADFLDSAILIPSLFDPDSEDDYVAVTAEIERVNVRNIRVRLNERFSYRVS